MFQTLARRLTASAGALGVIAALVAVGVLPATAADPGSLLTLTQADISLGAGISASFAMAGAQDGTTTTLACTTTALEPDQYLIVSFKDAAGTVIGGQPCLSGSTTFTWATFPGAATAVAFVSDPTPWNWSSVVLDSIAVDTQVVPVGTVAASTPDPTPTSDPTPTATPTSDPTTTTPAPDPTTSDPTPTAEPTATEAPWVPDAAYIALFLTPLKVSAATRAAWEAWRVQQGAASWAVSSAGGECPGGPLSSVYCAEAPLAHAIWGAPTPVVRCDPPRWVDTRPDALPYIHGGQVATWMPAPTKAECPVKAHTKPVADPILAKAPTAVAKPQVSRIPSGGVDAGDGSTAGIRTLPKTGGNELLIILVGVAALTAGGLLVAGRRRRPEEN